ncbi:hypothetical protein AYO46_03960 [Betaproteobacteria bacterium SCGC AG-212-J23]|nr:hypothetical protein AYO46_03960 [Betaproteobacteria bacterium SCGC AG-212-J23]
MDAEQGLTIHFVDGTKVSYAFPDQASNEAARQLRLEDFLKSPYVMVVADGVLTMLPVANIKAIQMPISEKMKKVTLPKHAIKGATLARGDF